MIGGNRAPTSGESKAIWALLDVVGNAEAAKQRLSELQEAQAAHDESAARAQQAQAAAADAEAKAAEERAAADERIAEAQRAMSEAQRLKEEAERDRASADAKLRELRSVQEQIDKVRASLGA